MSGLAAARGDSGLAVANLVGSNIINVTLILCVAALVAPDGSLVDTTPGGSAVGRRRYRVRRVRAVRPRPAQPANRRPDPAGGPPGTHLGREALRAVLGLGDTLLGAQLLVANAATAAQRLGVPQTVVGFTLVALGSSLPELVTAVQAQRRRNADLLRCRAARAPRPGTGCGRCTDPARTAAHRLRPASPICQAERKTHTTMIA